MEMKIPREYITLAGKLSGKIISGNLRRCRWLEDPEKTDDKGYPRATRESISWGKVSGGWHGREYFNFFKFE
jgi:hypothetical protein